MSSRLAFQTQLASIMEVLANAAVAEICKLVDDDYAVVSLQMSQCQRENKALKRKLHLLELKMARGNAERRLRESAMNSSRPKVQISTGGGLQGSSPSTGVLEHVPRGAVGRRPRLEQHNSQSTSSQSQVQSQSHVQIQSQSQSQNSSSSRGVEVSGSSPLLKCELSGSVEGRHSIQEAVNPPRYVDDGSSVLCDSDKHGNSLVEGFFDEPSGGEGEKGRPSCSYSLAAADFPSTSSTMNGWTHYRAAFALPQPFSDGSTAPPRVSKERLFVCSYCGKAFNRPKKVEIHQRVHTGEKPFSCSTCGKMFSEAGNLRKHQRVHTGEKPYSCGMCGRGFAWIRNLKTHQQKSHPEIYTEEENRGHE
uniref:C2H2-type domain-containing protein n=1 Tax=Stegastes partitus TaxID=144197 RepID=A0A3B5B5C1_9TELE